MQEMLLQREKATEPQQHSPQQGTQQQDPGKLLAEHAPMLVAVVLYLGWMWAIAYFVLSRVGGSPRRNPESVAVLWTAGSEAAGTSVPARAPK